MVHETTLSAAQPAPPGAGTSMPRGYAAHPRLSEVSSHLPLACPEPCRRSTSHSSLITNHQSLGFPTRNTLSSRFRSNSFKTKERHPSYPELESRLGLRRLNGFHESLASPKCHTLQGDFTCNSFKTKKSDTDHPTQISMLRDSRTCPPHRRVTDRGSPVPGCLPAHSIHKSETNTWESWGIVGGDVFGWHVERCGQETSGG